MTTLVAYIGPETTLPLASVLAAALGVVLAFGRSALRVARRCVGVVLKR